MNLFKSFDSGLGQYMRKAVRPSGGMESSNPRRWRGKRLHHHGGDVCCVFVLLWMDSWRHKLNVCKKWCKHNLKMRLMRSQSVPPRLAPHLLVVVVVVVDMVVKVVVGVTLPILGANGELMVALRTLRQTKLQPMASKREMAPWWWIASPVDGTILILLGTMASGLVINLH